MDKQEEIISKSLEGMSEKNYGAGYKDHLLAQYLKYVEMADKISERRSGTNTFYLSLNSALLAAIGISNLTSFTSNCCAILFTIVAVAGIVFCLTWRELISSYRDLNTSKFKVIHEMEKHLPIKMYFAEWQSVESGKNKKLYNPLSHIEKCLPVIFIIFYVLLIGCIIFAHCENSLYTKQSTVNKKSSLRVQNKNYHTKNKLLKPNMSAKK